MSNKSSLPAEALLEVTICEVGTDIHLRAQGCLGTTARITRVEGLPALLDEAPSTRRLLIISTEAIHPADRVLASGRVREMPVIWVSHLDAVPVAPHSWLDSAMEPDSPRSADWIAQLPHVLPRDFTCTELRQLIAILAQELRAHEADISNAQTLIAHTQVMHDLLAEADLFADCEHNVLIQGETGTGKDLVAQRLHRQHSRFGKGPFVAVNCGAIPEGLFESEFFGHARGAFTGALHPHKGYFEQAHGGTLFLDEVGELPLLQQVKLLRVLDSATVTRLGTTTPIMVDFRLVAATNRPMRQLVEKGQFRADLYYRLAVVELHMPNLESRGVTDKIAIFRALVKEVLAPSDAPHLDEMPFWLADSVAGMAFPGNVRQLRNLAERVGVIARQTGRWDVAMIQRALDAVQSMGQSTPIANGSNTALPRHNWDANERSRLITALERNAWKRAQTALHLGISRKVLWEKMRKYQISEGELAIQSV